MHTIFRPVVKIVLVQHLHWSMQYQMSKEKKEMKTHKGGGKKTREKNEEKSQKTRHRYVQKVDRKAPLVY